MNGHNQLYLSDLIDKELADKKPAFLRVIQAGKKNYGVAMVLIYPGKTDNEINQSLHFLRNHQKRIQEVLAEYDPKKTKEIGRRIETDFKKGKGILDAILDGHKKDKPKNSDDENPGHSDPEGTGR